MSGDPDPKPPRRPRRQIRLVDKKAIRSARLRSHACACCGRRHSNMHHVLAKGSPYFGDDVPGNLLALCGSGTTGCHGALHGSPYWDDAGKRWDARGVRIALGISIAARPDIIAYVTEKLGATAGSDYLARMYYLDIDRERTSA